MPLYRDLMKTQLIKTRKVAVVAVLPHSEEESKKYLEENHLDVDLMATGQTLNSFGIPGTPTMLLIKDGKMLTGWDGYQQNPEEVIAAFNKSSL